MKKQHPFRSATIIALLIGSSVVHADGQDLADGLALYEAGDVAAAQTIFAAIVATDSDNAEAIYNLGVTHLAQDDIDEAIESFERAVELIDDDSRYHQRLGEALGTKAGQVSVFKQMRMAGRIHDAFKRAVELDGKNIDARFGLMTFYLSAPGIAGGSTEKALTQAEAIRQLDEVQGQIAFAAIYSDQGEHEKAEAAYRAAIESSPEERDLYLALGIQLTAQERYADAIAVYEAGLDKLPDDMSINYQIGRTASIAGEFLDKGRPALESYIDNHTPRSDEPSLAWANYRLGLILQHLGQIEPARTAFQSALNLDPKHKEAKKALRRLR